jgi:hypothetical protein
VPGRLVRSTLDMGKGQDSVQSPELRAVTLLPPFLGALGHGRQEGRIAHGALDAIVQEAGPPAAPEGAARRATETRIFSCTCPGTLQKCESHSCPGSGRSPSRPDAVMPDRGKHPARPGATLHTVGTEPSQASDGHLSGVRDRAAPDTRLRAPRPDAVRVSGTVSRGTDRC